MPPELESIPPLGETPITEQAPAGTKIQDDLAFDQLQTDVQSLVMQLGAASEVKAIGEGEGPTWESVADRAYELLAHKSKDIRLASYLTLAMTHVRGFEGLHASCRMLLGLLGNFWETMYPPLKLVRARTNALDFIAEQIAGDPTEPGGQIQLRQQKLLAGWDELQKKNPPLDEERRALDAIQAQADGLRGVVEIHEKLHERVYEAFPADKVPSLSAIKEASQVALEELDRFLERNQPREPAARSPQGQPSAAQSATVAAPSASEPAAAAPESSEEVYRLLGRYAPLLRQADPTDPAGYRLSRWAIWSQVPGAPPTTDGVRTRIPDVQKAEVDQLQSLLAASNWMQLLNQNEERFPQTPLWLDRQYFTYMALNGMGPAYFVARDAVGDETRRLLERAPGLEGLQFAGGMPLADAATLAWIQSTVAAAGTGPAGASAPAAPAAGHASGEDPALQEALAEARELMRNGDLAQAIRRLEQGPPGMPSARSRFLWRMAQARLAQEGGKARQIAPVWEALLGQIDCYRLEEWEPELCRTVYRSLYGAIKGDKTRAELCQDVFRRLCRLDPTAALEGA